MFSGFIKDNVRYDSSFLQLEDSYRFLGFLKNGLLEQEWAFLLYYGTMTKSESVQFQNNYKLFLTYFPHSGYTSYLKQRFSYLSKDDSLRSRINKEFLIVDNQKYTSLKKLIADKFSNQYVFVDLWATWCKPCIQEFLNKNDLKAFLDKKNIKLLYLSIDDLPTIGTWRKLINSKKLYGYHSIASKQMIEDVQKSIYNNNTISIPRHLLIDKKGNIVDSDLPRTSDIKRLEERINELIDKQ